MRIEVIETGSLGDRSYVVHDGASAIVIDPQRDLDRVEEVLRGADLRVELVAETHVHNDYVSGGYQLARSSGARYVLNAADRVAFDRTPVSDGDELRAGRLNLRVLATPGHTDNHIAYLVTSAGGEHREPDPAVFTGGSLLFGTVGRTDLVDPARTDELTRAQYRSARRLAAELDERTRVFPTHGFGSFCSSAPSSGQTSATIAEERRGNLALVTDDERVFVRRLTEGLTDYPAYYAHIAPRNLSGPAPADLSPPETANAEVVRQRIAAREWVVDLRTRTAHAADHVIGTVNIGLDGSFATYLGWLVPWGAPVTLLADAPGQIAEAQRELVRIGFDRPAGAAAGPPSGFAEREGRRGFPVATFADLASAASRPPVLDVRRVDEWRANAVRSSRNIPLHELPDRTDQLPDEPVWVHCQSGYRAGIAASLLDRAGRDVVLVDDDFDEAVRLGLTAGGVTPAPG